MHTIEDVQNLLVRHKADVIVLFDGVCNFCNKTINFLIDKDQKRKLRYLPLRSPIGEAIKQQLPEGLDSIICVTATGIFTQSDAALAIAAQLPFPYRILKFLKFIPKSWRDYLYDAFSKRRYRWFGQADQCRIPSPIERKLFIETF